jgi:hypothetical protein
MNRDEKIALVRAAADPNWQMVLPPALADCHAKGVLSIWLDVGVRMFVADHHHELWRNATNGSVKMVTGFHPHRCDITLIPLFGDVLNICCDEMQSDYNYGSGFYACKYGSKIVDGEASLTVASMMMHRPGMLRASLLRAPQPMPAKLLHTIAAPRNSPAAWIVKEGEPDPSYSPICYTNNLEFDAKDMYRPMDHSQVRNTIDFVLRMTL